MVGFVAGNDFPLVWGGHDRCAHVVEERKGVIGMLSSKQIGETVRTVRMKRGNTTTVLAKKVGISQAQVSRLENGQQGFRSGTLVKIASALKVKPWYLFMESGEQVKARKKAFE